MNHPNNSRSSWLQYSSTMVQRFPHDVAESLGNYGVHRKPCRRCLVAGETVRKEDIGVSRNTTDCCAAVGHH
jgi:DNA-directed RNA polymerase subunit N (RpoN/RPB10)